MKRQLVICILAATFLLQYCDAASTPRSAESSNYTEVFTRLIEDYKISIVNTLKSSKDYLERSQTEISGAGNKWSNLNTRITELIGDINATLAQSEAQNISKMISCLVKVNSLPMELALRMDEEALELLGRNGFNTFLDDYQQTAVNFNAYFGRAVASYLDNLSDAKKINERNMTEWFGAYKSIKDTTKQFEKASEFFEKFFGKFFLDFINML